MTTTAFQALEVPIDQLFPSPINVRQEVGDVSELADSIREQGVLEPLIARRTQEGNYEVIIGSRRLAASRQVGLAVVPVVVQDVSDADAIVRSLVENLQRGDLTLEERVEAYKKLQDIEPLRFGNHRGIARVTGKTKLKIDQDFDAYKALKRLQPSGVHVLGHLSPSSTKRQAREAIPEFHATLLEQAMTSVRSRLPAEEMDETYTELAKAIAPLEQRSARQVLDYFKMYPERPIPEVTSMALATVQREVTLPADTARRLGEVTGTEGQQDWGYAIKKLIEDLEQPPPPISAHEEDGVESVGASQDTLPGFTETDAVSGPPRPPSLPEEPMPVQQNNRVIWNLQHGAVEADFYTVGYSGRDLESLIKLLDAAGVSTVVDVRHHPTSLYKPDFNEANLRNSLEHRGLTYVHRPDLGVPRDVRERAAETQSRQDIWEWYKTRVIGSLHDDGVKGIIKNFTGPVAFMCVEVDPSACHRHILFLELHNAGLTGFDL